MNPYLTDYINLRFNLEKLGVNISDSKSKLAAVATIFLKGYFIAEWLQKFY